MSTKVVQASPSATDSRTSPSTEQSQVPFGVGERAPEPAFMLAPPAAITREQSVSQRSVGLHIVEPISPALKDIIDNCIVPTLVKEYVEGNRANEQAA